MQIDNKCIHALKVYKNQKLYIMHEGPKKIVGAYDIYLNQALGSGANGKVYAGKNHDTNEPVAVKMIDRVIKSNHSASEAFLINSLKRQAMILSKINSEYVVGFRDLIATKRYYYIVQERCDGDLRGYLDKRKKNDNPLSEKQAVNFMVQILNGFYPLLVMNVIHRDIKPQNFLVKDEKIKLCDFGFSRKISGDKMLTSYGGTQGYQSPQVAHYQKYTSKCDIYSLGCVFYELTFGKNLFAVAQNKIESKMKQVDDIEFPIVPEVSEMCKDVIRKCLRYQEKDRIDWIQLFNHPLFVQKVPSLKKLTMALHYILSTIRKEIDEKNININKFLQKMGIRKDKQIGIQDYTKLLLKLTTIDKNITLQEIKYSFNYFDRDENGKVSFSEFAQALEKHGIEINGGYDVKTQFQLIYKVTIKQQQQTGDKFQDENLTEAEIEQINKCNRAYKKLLNEIIKKNIEDISQQFNLQDLGSEGINVDIFVEFIIKGLGLNMTEEECRLAFTKFDDNHDNKLQFAEFQKYVSKELQVESMKSLTQIGQNK